MKKIISLFIAACLCFSTMYCNIVFADATYLDAYSTITSGSFVDCNDPSVNPGDASHGLTRFSGGNRWIAYDIDFGTDGARVIRFEHTVPDSYAGGVVSVYLDSVSGDPVFQFTLVTTGSWSSFQTYEYLLDAPITGQHRVYLIGNKSGVCNYKTFQFKKTYSEITAPSFTLYDGTDAETDDFAAAESISASASVLNYAPSGIDANLVMIPYSGIFERLATIAVDTESNINNRDTAAALSIENALSGFDTNTVFFAALVDDGFKPMAESAFYNAPAVSEPTRTSEDKIDYYIDGTAVTVYGTLTDNSEKVLVGIRDESVSLGEYASYEFIYETSVTDGKYEHTFTMDEDTPTGMYTAVYGTSNETNEVDFHYSRPLDVVDAFAEINASVAPTDDVDVTNDIDDELNQWEETLGLDLNYINGSTNRTWMYTRIYEYLPFADLNELNAAVNKTVFLDKINVGDDDISTLESYKTTIGLNTDTYYTKYFSQADSEVLAEKMEAIMEDELPLMDVDSFIRIFKEAITVTMMSDQIAWGSIDEMISDFEEAIDSSYTEKYLDLSDTKRKKAAKEFLNKDFDSIDEVEELLEDAYKLATKEEKKSSGGGGGGYSTEYKVEVPEVEIPVYVAPVQDVKVNISFSDMSDFAWADDAVVYLATEGIISGKSENMYYPADNISREEFVKVLVLALGEIDENASCSFADVSTNAWYYPYVATAYSKGWINGYENGAFGIGENITREQMATMFYRTIVDTDGIPEIANSSVSFVDYGQISGYATEAVMNLARANLMNGTGMGLFNPKNNATRAETALLVYKYLINR